MSLLNRTSFLTSLIQAKIQHKNIPLTVIYNITDRCNSECNYCYLRYYNRSKPEASREQILAMIDELKKMGCKRISLGGGEPLLRDDIEEIINYVKKHNIDCIMNSNGKIVKEKIDVLKNTDAVCISLDGEKEVHDFYRGQGSFDKALEAIRILRQHNITVHTNTVLHDKNLNSLEYILKLAKKYGFLAEFNLLIGYLPDGTQQVQKPNNQHIRTAIKQIIDYKKRDYPILMSKKAYQYSLNWPDYKIESIENKKPGFKHAKCLAGKYFCTIDTDGRVNSCHHLVGKEEALSCYQVGFKKAFENLGKHNCRACYQVYHNEFNLLFRPDLSVIWNHAKNSLKTLSHGKI